MNRFITNINKIPIKVKHLSSKYHLNEIADHHSRNPATCDAVNCSIHPFIKELTDTVIDTAAKCSLIELDPSLTNRQAWIRAQHQSDACKGAVSHLTSGKVPTNKSGDLFNEMRHYM